MNTNDIESESTGNADNRSELRTQCGQGIGPSERATVEALAEAWNLFMRLDGRDYETERDFRQSINRAQDIIAYRVASRIDPDLWRPLPPSNGYATAPIEDDGHDPKWEDSRDCADDPDEDPPQPAEPFAGGIDHDGDCERCGTGVTLDGRCTFCGTSAESPTPRTDAAEIIERHPRILAGWPNGRKSGLVPKERMEELERELAEAREQRDRLADALRRYMTATYALRPSERTRGSDLAAHSIAASVAEAALTAVKGTTILGMKVEVDPALPPDTAELRDPKTGETLHTIKVTEE
jgi:hypothetical protein